MAVMRARDISLYLLIPLVLVLCSAIIYSVRYSSQKQVEVDTSSNIKKDQSSEGEQEVLTVIKHVLSGGYDIPEWAADADFLPTWIKPPKDVEPALCSFPNDEIETKQFIKNCLDEYTTKPMHVFMKKTILEVIKVFFAKHVGKLNKGQSRIVLGVLTEPLTEAIVGEHNIQAYMEKHNFDRKYWFLADLMARAYYLGELAERGIIQMAESGGRMEVADGLPISKWFAKADKVFLKQKQAEAAEKGPLSEKEKRKLPKYYSLRHRMISKLRSLYGVLTDFVAKLSNVDEADKDKKEKKEEIKSIKAAAKTWGLKKLSEEVKKLFDD